MYHGVVSTFAFADGHAEAHRWIDGSLIKYGHTIASGTTTTFTPPATVNTPDYHYIYNGYRFPSWKD